MLNALLSQEGLRTLHETHADCSVLSVYLEAEERDPALQRQWRLTLASGLSAVEQTLLEPAERIRFRAAAEQLHSALMEHGGPRPGSTWAAFVTEKGVLYAASLPRISRQRVRWRRGPLLAPYVRALKHCRPVIAAVVDSARARLFRYEAGEAWELIDYRADRFIDDLSDRNTSKRAATHSGVRGATGRDAARRTLDAEMERMLEDVAAATRHAAGSDALVLIGGVTEPRGALRRLLGSELEPRLAELDSMSVAMSDAEAAAAISAGASGLSRSVARATTASILELAGARGRGVAGPEAALAAARAGSVDLLLITERLTETHEDLAEELIAATLVYGGAVEEVAGEAAAMLDAAPGGAAARLRYAAVAMPPPVLEASG